MHEPHDATTIAEPVIEPGASFPAGALATFVAVARVGTISRAAVDLHLSQPAVTRRLQGLERELGGALFDRYPTGLRLTEAGRAFLPFAERCLAAERDGRRTVAARRDDAVGRVALGAVGSLVELYVTDPLRDLVDRHPGVEIDIRTATSVQIASLVRRGELDIGVAYAVPADDDVDVLVLRRERLRVVAAPHSPAARRVTGGADRGADLDELAADRWLVFPDPASHPETSGSIARRELERHGVRSLHEIDSLSAQRALCTAGYGLALLPESMIGRDVAEGRLVVIPVAELDVTAPITLLSRRHAYRSPATQALVDRLVDVSDRA